ncbi:hypothetical protein BS333_08545 [Vibrio azureus]|uniref:Translocator protein BipB-like C-terminal domain-containing protein n=1 Tax=Vibrio azureus NBRC 104587 TaxID=1219077 RepID=U3AWF2_9VIBR|nr:type III secretion system translocon subunit SctE [Vibrio azureus]AUI86432.1 hypothetical protein BS333_08545 [Vibrio azureus]GAD77557.1 hypothetical protein VAZ01S_080_00070 [Vibrio azureus NBRC 104587]
MSTFMSPISAAVNVIAVEEETKSKQSVSTQSTATESITPKQPLPGSSVNLNALWRMVEEQFKEVANALSGTGKEHSDAKKALIDAQKDSQINQLKERESKIAEQQKAAKKSNFWSKFGMALGIIAALVIAPFNPVMSAIMIGTMVAAVVIPKIADEVMKAAGVPEDIRNKVKMGLEIGIGIVGMLLSFSPAQLMNNIAKTAATTLSKVVPKVVTNAVTKFASQGASFAGKTASGAVKAAGRALQEVMENANAILKLLKAFCPKLSQLISKAQAGLNKAQKILDDLLENIQDFMMNSEKARVRATRASQVMEVSSSTSSVVSAGYGVKSADISKDLEIDEARQQELEARIQQILMMLDQALRSLNEVFQSIFKTNSDHRDFNQKMISIHM